MQFRPLSALSGLTRRRASDTDPAPQTRATPTGLVRGTEVLSIVHERDLRLGLLQLTSFDLLCDLDSLTRFTLVNNGGQGVREAVEAHLETLSPAFVERFTFIDAGDLSRARLTGWRGQQVVKLLFARRVTTSHYLVLDAKNHLVRPFSLDALHDEAGRARTVRRPPTPLLRPHLEASLSAFDLPTDVPDVFSSAMPTVTPYTFDTAEVLALISALKERSGKNFTAAFRTTYPRATEFYLYYAWLLHRHGSINQHHHLAPDLCITLFTVWPQTDALLETAMARVRDEPTICFFGLHPNRLPRLDDLTTRLVTELWDAAGLTTEHPASWYLTPPPPAPEDRDVDHR